MITTLATAMDLTLWNFTLLAAICLVAGMVRGFSGFALSAMVMASAATMIPPVELIPICWWLEIAASILMVRGGFQDANKKVAIGLALGSAIGVPLGLALTVNILPDTSKLVALCAICVLALLQLGRIRIPGLATNTGLASAGVGAGIVTGLAGIGGMMVALYVLARNAPPREMRASLVLFLFLGSITSFVSLFVFGVMDQTAVLRGLVMAIPTAIGVILGKMLFIPAWEKLYKPFCLILLVALAVSGIARLMLG
ncbi:MAG: TSUP family transporter [Planktomarina sp.]